MFTLINGTVVQISHRLVQAFFAKVPLDPILSRVYPKHLRCAIDSLTWYLEERLGESCAYSERRTYLSLREPHAKFRLGEAERTAWLRRMNEALDEVGVAEPVLGELRALFEQASAYLVGRDEGAGALWKGPRAMEDAVAALRAGEVDRAIAIAEALPLSSSLRAKFLAMVSESAPGYVAKRVMAEPALAHARFGGGCTLLHAVGDPSLIAQLASLGADANAANDGGHPPLYFVRRAGAVEALLAAGAAIDARSGVQQCTALHMAARRGEVAVARTLVAHGANRFLKDKRGDTPLDRAINCRKHAAAEFLAGL
jgi:hemoglobin